MRSGTISDDACDSLHHLPAEMVPDPVGASVTQNGIRHVVALPTFRQITCYHLCWDSDFCVPSEVPVVKKKWTSWSELNGLRVSGGAAMTVDLPAIAIVTPPPPCRREEQLQVNS